MSNQRITSWLQQCSGALFSTYAIAAAFSTYFCMYAFRKPFAAGNFAGQVEIFGHALDYKIFLIISHLIGYCISKFWGIRLVSQVTPQQRARLIVTAISASLAALFLFAFTPKPYAAFFLFCSTLPLGLIWGLVFSFLEGRQFTDALGAGLSLSYIVASGATKSVGRQLMQWGVAQNWMPAVTGLIFLPALLLAVYFLKQLPSPNATDEALRTKRQPMRHQERWLFFKSFWPGLIVMIILYMFLTAFRDFRDNFAPEIWDSLGYGNKPSILTTAEIPIAIGVLIALGALIIIKNNRRAVFTIHLAMIAGTALIGLATLAYQQQWLSPVAWMVNVGLGLYLAYVPFGCILFDRLIGALGFIGTAGFMIYVTDAFGYLGSILILLYKNFSHPYLSWMNFFSHFSLLTSLCCSLLLLLSMIYFNARTNYKVSNEKAQ